MTPLLSVRGHAHPAGQEVQVVAPASEYVPLVHWAGTLEALPQEYPAGQVVHVVLAPTEKVPAVQAVTVEVLVEGQAEPAGHLVHTRALPVE